jgi:hypothetical protein
VLGAQLGGKGVKFETKSITATPAPRQSHSDTETKGVGAAEWGLEARRDSDPLHRCGGKDGGGQAARKHNPGCENQSRCSLPAFWWGRFWEGEQHRPRRPCALLWARQRLGCDELLHAFLEAGAAFVVSENTTQHFACWRDTSILARR